MNASAKLFSAVILSYNSARYIKHCLNTLAAAFSAFAEPCEIWVVDNGSSDGSVKLIEEAAALYAGVVRPIFLPVNTGTTVSRNQALRAAEGRYVLVLDSDATITSDALAKLRALLEREPDVGIAVPRLTYPDGRFQISTDQFPTVTRKLQRLMNLKSMEETAVAPDASCNVDYAISACWLLRRELLEVVGLLDENIFYSPEDVDYCVRVWLAGYRIVYEPAATVIHDAQELSRGKKIGKFKLKHAEGLGYYFRKHGYCFSLGGLYRRIAKVAPSHAG